MNLFIFKTDLNSNHKIFRLRKVLSNRALIKRWTIDLEDVDKILKVFVTERIQKLELITLLENSGIDFEELE